MMKTKTITVSSVFPAATDVIWPKLQSVETLQYIAAPYASFRPVNPQESMVWEPGATFRFHLRVFGFISMGIHTIQVDTFDSERGIIETRESNRMVPVWNHKILLSPVDAAHTHYTDEVELYAKGFTGIVCLWSRMFYRHRQKKWLKLLG